MTFSHYVLAATGDNPQHSRITNSLFCPFDGKKTTEEFTLYRFSPTIRLRRPAVARFL